MFMLGVSPGSADYRLESGPVNPSGRGQVGESEIVGQLPCLTGRACEVIGVTVNKEIR
jgi:hypothetical protein